MAEFVTIQGLNVFAQALKILPANVARRVLRGAVAAGGKVIRDEAKAKAPVFTGKGGEGDVDTNGRGQFANVPVWRDERRRCAVGGG